MSSWDLQKSRKVADMPRVNLENRIKLYRTAKGWNQHQLAKEMGLGVGVVHRIETRLVEPKVSLAYQFCDALGVSIENLFYKPGEVPPIQSDVR